MELERNRKLTNLFLLVCIVLTAVGCSFGRKSQSQSILVFFDQPCTYETCTKAFSDAMHEEFGDSTRYQLEICAEYIDKQPDSVTEQHYRRTLDDYRSCHGGNPDEIIAVGDNAVRVLANSPSLRKDSIPVIFMNIACPEHAASLDTIKYFTGFTLDTDFRKSLEMIRTLSQSDYLEIGMGNDPIDSAHIRLIGQQLSDTARYHYGSYFEKKTKVKKLTRKTYLVPVSAGTFSASLLIRDEDNRVYTLSPHLFGIHEGMGETMCVGGYMPPYAVMAGEVRGIVDKLAKGEDILSIPPAKHKADYWLDWNAFAGSGMCRDDFPFEAKFINLPWYEKNATLHWLYYGGWKNVLTIVIAGLILVTLAIFLTVFSAKIILRKKESDELATIKSVVESLRMNDGFTWEIDKEYVHILSGIPGSFTDRHRRISINLLLRCIKNDWKRLEVQTLMNGLTADGNMKSIRLEVKFGPRGTRHLLNIGMTQIMEKQKRSIMGICMIEDKIEEQKLEVMEALKAEESSQMREVFICNMEEAIVHYSRLLTDYAESMSGGIESMDKQQIDKELLSITQAKEALVDIMDNASQKTNHNSAFSQDMHYVTVSQIVKDMYLTHSVLVPDHLHFELAEGEQDAELRINLSAMRQISYNLISNAIKYTPRGKIRIGWETNDESVTIFVEDSGAGLSEEQQKNIFRTLHLNNASNNSLGIGLPLCAKIAKAMGAELRVESAAGRGSKFILTFPTVR